MKEFIIYIDQKQFKIELQFITGSQLKELAKVPYNYGVWLQVYGSNLDKEIADNEQIDLNQPYTDRFFTGNKFMTEG